MIKNYRGRNWYTAMGILFITMAAIIIIRDLIVWGPEFVVDFFISNELTSEKISSGMIVFGSYLIFVGYRKSEQGKF